MKTDNQPPESEPAHQTESGGGSAAPPCSAPFTPGPWIVDEPARGRDHINVWTRAGIGHVAAVSTGLLPDPSAFSNARLIAAAPEMLQALERIRDYQGRFGEDDPQSIAADMLAKIFPQNANNAPAANL